MSHAHHTAAGDGGAYRMRQRDRSCELCGNDRLEQVFRHGFQSRTRNALYQWDVRVVLCPRCGFAFASPAPEDQDLLAYYADSFAASPLQQRDYSLEKRLALIDRFREPGRAGVCVEAGGNAAGDFAEGLRQRFRQVLNAEPNQSCAGSHSTLGELGDGCADMVAAYFVLEHAARPLEFLRDCARILRVGGLCVLEVPDLHAYPKSPVSLLLYEHLNHFSPRTLDRLCRAAGLEAVHMGARECSRGYGFAAMLRKSGRVLPAYRDGDPDDAREAARAAESLRQGVEALHGFFAEAEAVRERLDSHAAAGGRAVIWGANDVCLHLLAGRAPAQGVEVVDSNPAKADFLRSRPVLLPEQAAGHIRASTLFVVCTQLHAGAITRTLEGLLGRPVEDVLVLDLPDAAG
ncbi:MAG: hypothetical protein CVU73_06285 [Deltaproteobacteria bacterium HGW-Deltaproteobacteria-8]|jgi:SAM-dependent methyltransferase|nr:MAG: hypothetical protein CVU73_06285 [Deltaproteobacteria bacterium HGW-Deltaproteobacteria-8]